MSVRSKPVDVELSERSFHSSSSESRARKRRRKYPVDPSLKPPLEPSSASPLSLPAGVKLNILEHEVVGEINSAEKSDAKYGQPANTANDMESGSDDCTNRFSHGKVFVPSQSDAKSTNVSSVGNSAVGVRPFESQKVVGLSETAIASVSRISASAGPTTSVSHLKPEPTPVLATASSVALSPATSPVLATALVAPARFADYLNSVDVGKRGLSYPIRYRKDGRPAKKPGPKPGTRQRRKLPMNSSDTDISSATSGADQYQMFAAPSQPGASAVHDTSSQHDTDSKLGADATSEKNLVFLPVGSSVTLVSFFRSTSQCLAIGTALSPGPNGTYVVVSFYRKREFRQPVSKFRIRESMLREVPANKVHLEPGDVIGPESIVHPNVWFGPECLLAPIRDSGLLEVVLAPRRELRLGDSFVPSAPPHFAPSVPSAPRRSLISPNSKAIANLLANLPSPTTLTEAALFAGWRLCLCGKIRPDKACMERILLDRGGIVRTGVSADLSVVVSTQKEVKRGGVKIVRAHSRNIPILDTSWVVDSIMNGKVQPVEPYAMKYVGTKRLVHLQDSGESEDLNENDSEDIESNLPPGSSALASSENSDWDDQPSNVRSGRWSIPEIKMLNDLIKRHTTVGTRLWKSELEQKLQLPKYAKLRLRNLESVRQKVALMRADKLAVMKARARDPSSGNRNPESGGIIPGSSDIGEGGRRDENSIHKLADAIEIAGISGSSRYQDGETASAMAGSARPPPIHRKSSGEKSSESPDDLYLSESDSRRSRSISGQFSNPAQLSSLVAQASLSGPSQISGGPSQSHRTPAEVAFHIAMAADLAPSSPPIRQSKLNSFAPPFNVSPPIGAEIEPHRRPKRARKTSQKVQENAEAWVDCRVAILWPDDNAWYEGIVQEFDAETGKHFIIYDDGGTEWIELAKESVKLIKEDERVSSSTSEEFGIPAAKRRKGSELRRKERFEAKYDPVARESDRPDELETGAEELETGVDELEAGAVEFDTGTYELETGAVELATGAVERSQSRVEPSGGGTVPSDVGEIEAEADVSREKVDSRRSALKLTPPRRRDPSRRSATPQRLTEDFRFDLLDQAEERERAANKVKRQNRQFSLAREKETVMRASWLNELGKRKRSLVDENVGRESGRRTRRRMHSPRNDSVQWPKPPAGVALSVRDSRRYTVATGVAVRDEMSHNRRKRRGHDWSGRTRNSPVKSPSRHVALDRP
eukprot:79706_1